MKVSRNIGTAILVLFLSSLACNLPSNQQATPDAYQAAALTVTALAGTAIEQPSATSTVTPFVLATSTVFVPPAATSVVVSSTPGGTFFVVDVGANCRTGPGTVYDKVTSFVQGTYLIPVGHNSDNSWWYVLVGNTNCWISGSTGHTTGPLSNLPLISAPPTPTVAVTGTSYP